jgi:hypothetical protein
MTDIRASERKNEDVVWRGQPDFWVFLFASPLLQIIPFGVLWLAI